MPEPYYQDETVTLYLGDAATVLADLPDCSVNCVVTSPPYFGLRDYGVDGQIGAEPSPAEYVAALRDVFSQVRRVLADDGTLWLNLGDSYNNTSSGQNGTASTGLSGGRHDRMGGRRSGLLAERLSPKNLLGAPWRVAFALQDDGWILRNDIIWHKPNAMPESVADRLSTRYEHLFLFSKSRRYWFDLDPIRETSVYAPGSSALNWARASKEADVPGQSSRQHRAGRKEATPPGANPQTFGPMGHRNAKFHDNGRNPGDVWSIPTAPFAGAHFAAYPPELPRRCIAAGCKPGGVVLDPFHGSGTTGMMAQRLGRRYIGIDLSADYLDLSLRTRLADGALPFEVGA